MITVYLVRHGSAHDLKPESTDEVRELTKAGRREIKTIGRALRKAAAVPDLILSSHAERAISTAKLLARKLRMDEQNIRIENQIYTSSSPQTLVDLIRSQDSGLSSLAMVGHNPTLSALASLLCPAFEKSMDKGSVLAIGFPVNRLADIKPSSGQISFYLLPDSPDDLAASQLEILMLDISRHLGAFFMERQKQLPPELEQELNGCSRKLAGKFLKSVARKTRNQKKS